MRRWELVSGGSAKFWEIGQDGVVVTVRFGRLGTAGQTKAKELASADAAQAHVAKLVAEKEKKGYRAVDAAAADQVAAVGRPAAEAASARVVDQPAAAPAADAARTPAADQPATAAPTYQPAATSAVHQPTATSAAHQPTAASVANQPTAASVANQPAAVDEDTWVMPKAWLRNVVRQRGFDPAPVFSVDLGLAEEARRQVRKQTATIERVLSEPTSEQELVQAAREHLAGRPDPVGAAAIAAIVKCGPQSVHAWIADHGVAFAVAAAVEFTGLISVADWFSKQHTWGNERLQSRGNYFHIILASDEGQMLTTARYATATADDAERAAAEAALDRVTKPIPKLVRTYVLPGRADWFREACQTPHSSTAWWVLPCSASTLHEFEQSQSSLTNCAFVLHTAVYVLGPAVAPLLAKELDEPYQRAESRKQVLKTLAALPTDEAFTILLDRLDTKYARPALLSAMVAFPARAARLLAERASGDRELRQLLTVHLTKHPQLDVPEGFTAVESALVPEAAPEELPPLLAEPPWLHRKPPVKPVVVPDLPVPEPSIAWAAGEREEWLASGYWNTHLTWQHLLEEYRNGRIGYRMTDLLAIAPEDEVRHILKDWVPNLGWHAESAGKRLASRFGLDALRPLLQIVENSSHAAEVLLPYASPEVAALMADWLVRLKQVRRVALDWLARHREQAARFLIPAALGKPGAERRNAETAIRHLHGLGVDVEALAPTPEAAAALRTVLAVDPADVLPARLPVLGEWAETRLLPQVLLHDRKRALSPQAARNLLMTAALSRPGEVYAGLPRAREALDRDSLAEFAWAVFQLWQEVGAPPKESWALSALGWFGNDETVRRLSPLIRNWPGESQHAKAVAGLDVLADIGTEVALSHLNSIAEKVKFKALKQRAQAKVAQIATELGLSRDQLADRLVPRLGLDDEASLVIDYGARRFTVGFDEHLKPYVLDPDGKRRKDLPKPGAKDDQDQAPLEHKRFMALKKDVRAVAADQIHRLERAMVDQRTWTAEEFHTVLAGHPLLWHIVRRLVWITDGGLSFRLAEDRTLADSGDDEFVLPEDATVRVAHPVDLRDSIEAWGEVFADYEILQPFPQLGRPLHVLTPGEDLVARLAKHRDVEYPVGRILGLTKKGWVRGEPQDAGIEFWITRPLPGGGTLQASLDPGIAVSAVDAFPEVRFAELSLSPGTAEIDPITVSELLSELESLHPL